jgi:hypothetical protein
MYKRSKHVPYTVAEFEHGIFCSVGGEDDHAARAQFLCFNIFYKDNLGAKPRFFLSHKKLPPNTLMGFELSTYLYLRRQKQYH